LIRLKVNGKFYSYEDDPDTALVWVLREHFGLTGTKWGCGVGLCGCCTVHIDGIAERSCQIPVKRVEGKEILTIEGLPRDHYLKVAWLEEEVPECGYCQPGQIMRALELLNSNPNPSEEDILQAMDSNLCRCGTYNRIKRAILRASRVKT